MHAARPRRVGVQRRPLGAREGMSGRACSQTCKGVLEHTLRSRQVLECVHCHDQCSPSSTCDLDDQNLRRSGMGDLHGC